MKFNELRLTAKKSSKRIGRGIAAGGGKTAGRGTKGQKARKSGGVRPGFEGGQNPLAKRTPKLRGDGFRSKVTPHEVVYTEQINALKGTVVDNTTVAEAGLVSSPYVKVKLLARGNISSKLTVKLQAVSGNALEIVQKAGGTFEKTPRLPRAKKAKKE